jgi:hypothetical protein
MTATDTPTAGGALRAGSDKASEAGRFLGSIRTERKAEASRANILAAKAAGKVGGRPQKPLRDYACTCGAGDTIEGHKSTCPRGNAIWRRRRAGKPVEL